MKIKIGLVEAQASLGLTGVFDGTRIQNQMYPLIQDLSQGDLTVSHPKLFLSHKMVINCDKN